MRVGFMAFTLAALVAVPVSSKFSPISSAAAAPGDPAPPLFNCSDLGGVGVDNYLNSQDQTFKMNSSGLLAGTSVAGAYGVNDRFTAVVGQFTEPTSFPTSGCATTSTSSNLSSLSNLPNAYDATTQIYSYNSTIDSVASAVNASGVVAGWIGSSSNTVRNAVVWVQTTGTAPAWSFKLLSRPTNSTYVGSVAYDINDNGVIVGAVIDNAQNHYAAYWASDAAEPVVLNYSYAGQTSPSALKGEIYAINNSGQMVGGIIGNKSSCNQMGFGYITNTTCAVDDYNGSFAATLTSAQMSAGVATHLGTVNGAQNIGGWGAMDINANGAIVGSSILQITNPYYGLKSPPPPPGAPATSIASSWPVSQPFAYLSSTAGMSNIGTIDAIFPIYTPNAWATAINDNNHVVTANIVDTSGYTKVNYNSNNSSSSNQTGSGTNFTWEPVAFLARYVTGSTTTTPHWTQDNLTSLVPSLPAGTFVAKATDINNNDRIVALARVNYEYHLVVLTLSPQTANVVVSAPTATTTTSPAMAAKTRNKSATQYARIYSGTQLNPADTVTATLNFTNFGPSKANNFVLNAMIEPAELVVLNSIVAPQGCDSPVTRNSIIYLNCSLPDAISAGDSKSVDVAFNIIQNLSDQDINVTISATATASNDTGGSANVNAKNASLYFVLPKKATPSTSPSDPGSTTTPPATTEGGNVNTGNSDSTTTSTTSSKKSGFGCTLQRGGGDDVDVSLALLMLLASGSMIRARRRVYFKN